MRPDENDQAIAQKNPILIGTSGYSYAEWVDAGFYPAGTKSGDMLNFYASVFPVTELNFTWYQMPKMSTIERMCYHAPAFFQFTAKLTRTLTHEIDLDQWKGHVAKYREGITPLLHAKKLVAVLVQFPKSFQRSPKNRHYLAMLLDELQPLPLAVEFRNSSWAVDRVFAEFERRHITLVTVDAPNLPGLFPQLDVITNPGLFYVRFHGRNQKGWWSGNMQLQFDYDYSDEELDVWSQDKLIRMGRQVNHGVVFFNNHVRGQAPNNAKKLIQQLKSKGILRS